jgi:signal transduction histidine kinase
MKLLGKTSLIYLLSTALVFLAGGWIFYFNLRNIVDEEATEHIYDEKTRVEKYIKEHDRIPVTELRTGDFISFQPSASAFKENLSDTIIYSKEEEELLPYRTLKFSVKAGEQYYSVFISKALFESDDLIEAILTSFTAIAVVLLVITVIVNRIASKRLWKPFLGAMEQLERYKVNSGAALHFEKTSTTEFSQLNEALKKMTEKIESDYHNLKAFTENASHEMQTPLAVIMTSAENLLQEKKQDQQQAENIRSIHQTAHRLSKLNQALLLLAKIENRQFEIKEETGLSRTVETKLEVYKELIGLKEISLESSIAPEIKIMIHPALADVLVSNLLTNAIRHTRKGGEIKITLDKEKLLVSNSGEPLHSPEKLFERFYKENPSSESTGLGLALVKQVAETSGMKIAYNYADGFHNFEIHFHVENR